MSGGDVLPVREWSSTRPRSAARPKDICLWPDPSPFQKVATGNWCYMKICPPLTSPHFLTFRSECICLIGDQSEHSTAVLLQSISVTLSSPGTNNNVNILSLIMEEAVPFSIVSTVKALSGALRSDAEHEAEISREREKRLVQGEQRQKPEKSWLLVTQHGSDDAVRRWRGQSEICAYMCVFYFLCYDLFLACTSDRSNDDFTHGLKRRLDISSFCSVMNHRVTDTELSEYKPELCNAGAS